MASALPPRGPGASTTPVPAAACGLWCPVPSDPTHPGALLRPCRPARGTPASRPGALIGGKPPGDMRRPGSERRSARWHELVVAHPRTGHALGSAFARPSGRPFVSMKSPTPFCTFPALLCHPSMYVASTLLYSQGNKGKGCRGLQFLAKVLALLTSTHGNPRLNSVLCFASGRYPCRHVSCYDYDSKSEA